MYSDDKTLQTGRIHISPGSQICNGTHNTPASANARAPVECDAGFLVHPEKVNRTGESLRTRN